MAVLPIITGADHPLLRRITSPVKAVTADTIALLRDMEETTASAKGAGIAAPQVGSGDSLCIALINSELIPLINPVITWMSEEKERAEEGCLSLPGIWLWIERSKDIIVEFTDRKNKKRELRLSGFDARVVQHEVDHLNGILIVDYVDSKVPKADSLART